ncbi:hypothetical protein ABK040_004034 [Willaertia magna]
MAKNYFRLGWRITEPLLLLSVEISETSKLNKTGKTDFERLINFIVSEDEKLSRYWRACTELSSKVFHSPNVISETETIEFLREIDGNIDHADLFKHELTAFFNIFKYKSILENTSELIKSQKIFGTLFHLSLAFHGCVCDGDKSINELFDSQNAGKKEEVKSDGYIANKFKGRDLFVYCLREDNPQKVENCKHHPDVLKLLFQMRYVHAKTLKLANVTSFTNNILPRYFTFGYLCSSDWCHVFALNYDNEKYSLYDIGQFTFENENDMQNLLSILLFSLRCPMKEIIEELSTKQISEDTIPSAKNTPKSSDIFPEKGNCWLQQSLNMVVIQKRQGAQISERVFLYDEVNSSNDRIFALKYVKNELSHAVFYTFSMWTLIVGIKFEGKNCEISLYDKENVDLSKFLDENKLDFDLKRKFSLDLLFIMSNLLEIKLFHADIKPTNIIVCKKPSLHLRLIDFEGAKELADLNDEFLASQLIGTTGYMAPERKLKDSKVNIWSDVYSMGLVIIEVWCGKPCVKKINEIIDEDIKRVVKQMLVMDPKKREFKNIKLSANEEKRRTECFKPLLNPIVGENNNICKNLFRSYFDSLREEEKAIQTAQLLLQEEEEEITTKKRKGRQTKQQEEQKEKQKEKQRKVQ